MSVLRRYWLLLLMLGLCGCSTLTAVQSSQTPRLGAPTYENYEDYYFWGLISLATVPVGEICPAQVSQIQSLYTVEDILFNTLSLGIYSPRTYRVWCDQKKEVRQ